MDLLVTDPDQDRIATLVFGHGAGAAMDGPAMTEIASRLTARGIRVVRFEFGYMAARRNGVRRPPPRAETLTDEYLAAVEAIEDAPLFIGGKSLGGRVATMVADALHRTGRIRGVVAVGYPFHPPEKPAQLRTAHLVGLETPALVCQGTRDPFGGPDDVGGYGLSPTIELRWFEDGDHDLRPRKAVSGFTHREHLDAAADAIRDFIARHR